MTAAALLSDLTAAGLALTVDPPNTIVLRGDPDARARFLPEIREHKAALLTLLTAPRYRWLITLPTGERFSCSFSPPQTRAEVMQWHPGALAVELEPEDLEGTP